MSFNLPPVYILDIPHNRLFIPPQPICIGIEGLTREFLVHNLQEFKKVVERYTWKWPCTPEMLADISNFFGAGNQELYLIPLPTNKGKPMNAIEKLEQLKKEFVALEQNREALRIRCENAKTDLHKIFITVDKLKAELHDAKAGWSLVEQRSNESYNETQIELKQLETKCKNTETKLERAKASEVRAWNVYNQKAINCDKAQEQTKKLVEEGITLRSTIRKRDVEIDHLKGESMRLRSTIESMSFSPFAFANHQEFKKLKEDYAILKEAHRNLGSLCSMRIIERDQAITDRDNNATSARASEDRERYARTELEARNKQLSDLYKKRDEQVSELTFQRNQIEKEYEKALREISNLNDELENSERDHEEVLKNLHDETDLLIHNLRVELADSKQNTNILLRGLARFIGFKV